MGGRILGHHEVTYVIKELITKQNYYYFFKKTQYIMSHAKMGINGFGRIGRLVFRSAFKNHTNTNKVMAINDPFMDLDYLIYLLKYDTVHGKS